MKRILILSIISLFILISENIAQSCQPAPFLTQGSIDSFQLNYPGCTEIAGNSIISGMDITNLNGLNTLTRVGKTLEITENPSLVNLEGLNELSSVNNLEVQDNESLTSLKGLENLIAANNLRIADNPVLSSLNGLEGLTNVSEFYIVNNNALNSLNGLENIDSIPRILWISSNDSLVSLNGLNNLTTIGKRIIPRQGYFSLIITDNISLMDLNGLNNLFSTEGTIRIGNENLNTLTGLENLTLVGGSFFISGTSLASLSGLNGLSAISGPFFISHNESLTSLTGLENLDYESIGSLSIHSCPLLSVCNIQSICDYLANGGTGNFHDNAPGCNSENEIIDACEAALVYNNTFVQIYPNPSNGIFLVQGKSIEEFDVRIRDLSGNVLREGLRVKKEKEIDISDLPNGSYLLEARNDNLHTIHKIIKID